MRHVRLHWWLAFAAAALSACGTSTLTGASSGKGAGYGVSGTIIGLTASGLNIKITDAGSLSDCNKIQQPRAGDNQFFCTDSISPGDQYSLSLVTDTSFPELCVFHDSQSVQSSNYSATTAKSDFEIDCRPKQYSVTGAITGLQSAGLVITEQNTGQTFTMNSGDGSFTFGLPSNGGPYSFIVTQQPSRAVAGGVLNQYCAWKNGLSGASPPVSVANGNVNFGDPDSPILNCQTLGYNVNVSVSGLYSNDLVIFDNQNGGRQVFTGTLSSGSLGYQKSAGTTLVAPATGSATYGVTDGQSYSLTISQPLAGALDANGKSLRKENCYIENAAIGVVAGQDIAVRVTCRPVGRFLYVASNSQSTRQYQNGQSPFPGYQGWINSYKIAADTGALTPIQDGVGLHSLRTGVGPTGPLSVDFGGPWAQYRSFDGHEGGCQPATLFGFVANSLFKYGDSFSTGVHPTRDYFNPAEVHDPAVSPYTISEYQIDYCTGRLSYPNGAYTAIYAGGPGDIGTDFVNDGPGNAAIGAPIAFDQSGQFAYESYIGRTFCPSAGSTFGGPYPCTPGGVSAFSVDSQTGLLSFLGYQKAGVANHATTNANDPTHTQSDQTRLNMEIVSFSVNGAIKQYGYQLDGGPCNCSQNSPGSIYAFDINGDGTLTLLDIYALDANGVQLSSPASITLDDTLSSAAATNPPNPVRNLLYVPTGGFQTSNKTSLPEVATYSVDPSTGRLTAVNVVADSATLGSATDILSPALSINGDLFVSNSNANTISLFHEPDAPAYNLVEDAGSPFSSPYGVGVQTPIAHPSGRFIFVLNSTSTNIAVYETRPTLNGQSGLAFVGSYATGASSESRAPMTVDPSGAFLYVSDAVENKISAFAIDQNTGALTQVVGSPFTVTFPAFNDDSGNPTSKVPLGPAAPVILP